MPVTSLIQSRYDARLVYPCGYPRWHPWAEPKLVKPTKAPFSFETSGPPLSPRHALRCCSPRAQMTLFLKIKNGKSGKHCSNGIVFNEVYCKIGAISFSVVFKRPFPMIVTSNFFAGVQVSLTGLIVSDNLTFFGSLIKAISLWKKVKK